MSSTIIGSTSIDHRIKQCISSSRSSSSRTWNYKVVNLHSGARSAAEGVNDFEHRKQATDRRRVESSRSVQFNGDLNDRISIALERGGS